VDVREFVNANADRFAALRDPLELSFDDFIRTSSDPRHAPGVERLWRASRDDFYLKSYSGLYCAGCEQFVTEEWCPEHNSAPERVSEQNWFFRLSQYTDRILDALSTQVRIEPAARRNEVLSFVRAGLADISVSRPAARSGGWGIPVPDDPSQVIYVWWDALANYVTANPQWWANAERVHVIGKGIVRFHAVYWIALLLSAGLPLPDTIFVHDYLTVRGAKISKSVGDPVRPTDLVARFGVDAVRWWLLREPAKTGDTDFTEQRLVERYDTELANGVGNLVNRVVGLGAVPGDVPEVLSQQVDIALQDFDFRAATGAVVAAVDDANRLIEQTRPWQLTGADRESVLRTLTGRCHAITRELGTFLPAGTARLAHRLAGGPTPAFPRAPHVL
jgi:methionyl-tRNA synthetase